MNTGLLLLLVVLVLSGLLGWWLAGRKVQEKPVRVMMFVGYFWLFTFLQLALLALLYFVRQHFFS
ncbi:MAG: hypothetical protein ACU836_01850 [Gammaproteobacteria bacterium]